MHQSDVRLLQNARRQAHWHTPPSHLSSISSLLQPPVHSAMPSHSVDMVPPTHSADTGQQLPAPSLAVLTATGMQQPGCCCQASLERGCCLACCQVLRTRPKELCANCSAAPCGIALHPITRPTLLALLLPLRHPHMTLRAPPRLPRLLLCHRHPLHHNHLLPLVLRLAGPHQRQALLEHHEPYGLAHPQADSLWQEASVQRRGPLVAGDVQQRAPRAAVPDGEGAAAAGGMAACAVVLVGEAGGDVAACSL